MANLGDHMIETLEKNTNKAGFNKTGVATAIGTAVGATMSGGLAFAEERALEEIIVTAKKRDTSLQETPLAMTAITDEEITLQRFSNFEDYVGQVPGLAYSDRQPGAKSVIMRGCAAQGLAFSDSATTSVYLDEQPITYAGYNPDPRLVDVARIEALSGPQGSLFGDAAQCGTLRIITNKPDTNESDGWIDLTGSSISDGGTGYDVSGMVNIPIQEDKVALRLVGFYADEAGWIDNVLSPSPAGTTNNASQVGDDVNESVWYGGRAALRIKANDQWTVDLTGIYQYYELEGFGDVSLNQQLYSDTTVFPTFGDDEQARFTKDYWEDEWYQLALTIEGDLDVGNFVLSANYFDRDSEYFADSTAYLQRFQQRGDYIRSFNTGNPYYDAGGIYDFGGDPIANDFDRRTTETYAIEARYATPTDGRWSAIVGGFYSKSEVEELFIANVQGLTGTAAFQYLNYAGNDFYNVPLKTQSNNWFSGTYDTEFEQYALFGEISVNLTENFSVTAGGRFYGLDRDYTVTSGTLVGLNGGIPNCDGTDYCYAPGFKGSGDENGFVPKITASYKVDDKMVYATYSEGFRRGGANSARPQSLYGSPSNLFPAPAGTFNEYESDEVINYEIGAKTDWMDNTLRFNIAVYHMEWNDIQIQAEDTVTGTGALGIVNFPQAEIDGVEAWINWLPSDNLQIDATIGYNDGELSKDDVLFGGAGLAIPAGTRLPIVPDLKANVNVTYSFESTMFNAAPYLMVRWTYTGESVNSLAGIESSSFIQPVTDQGSWSTVDLQFGLESESWTVTVFMDNVTDEEAELFFNNRFAQQRLSVNQPRSFGVNFRRYFNR